MATIVASAAKGQRKAMTLLYEANKQKVYYTALNLTKSEGQAVYAVGEVFRDALAGIPAENISTEEEFTRLVVRKTIDFCKARTVRKNASAFRVPKDRNFRVTVKSEIPAEENDAAAVVVSRLPDLQNFLLILENVCGYTTEQMAEVVKMDAQTLSEALESEKNAVSDMLGNGRTYESLIAQLQQKEKETAVPEKADKAMASYIDSVAGPLEKKRKKRTWICTAAVLLCVLIVGGIFLGNYLANRGKLDPNLTYYADIEIADYGTITVQLDQKTAPITCANFVNLAESGFYDGLTFHRIKKGFMMQGGDPKGNGTGGSGEKIVGEFSDNGYENDISHVRGVISMARSSDSYDSASSQFFIVHEDSTFLDGQYAAFGWVVEGMEIVDAVCEDAEPTDNNGTIPSENQPVITSITIRTE